MKTILKILLLFLTFSVFSQENIKENYDKKEVYITMRDGVKLFTAIYTPKRYF
jgi:uncharacterized protein